MVLKIYAKFTGLRYVLYHWPVFSAIFGISTNLVMLLFIALLSWYQCLSKKTVSQDYDTYGDFETLEERRNRIRSMIDQEKEDTRATIRQRMGTDKPETIGADTTEELLDNKQLDTDSLLRHRHVQHSSEDDDHNL